MTIRALVIEESALSSFGRSSKDSPGGENKTIDVVVNDIKYVIGDKATMSSRLLVISGLPNGPLAIDNERLRNETMSRIIRAALSTFWPGLVKLPVAWRQFHAGSLLSFQANRLQAGVRDRVYLDRAPEDTQHVYAFVISKSDSDPLSRDKYDSDLFIESFVNYPQALEQNTYENRPPRAGAHSTFSLGDTFSEGEISQGFSFTFWRDAKLSKAQRDFFEATFDGPLRLKGAAGTGKTLALTMRFLKEVYSAIDARRPLRICFLSHGEETVENIRRNILQIDERGVLFNSPEDVSVELTTLHGLAAQFINTDVQGYEPLSLDGTSGRQLQLEVIESVVERFKNEAWSPIISSKCSNAFSKGFSALPDDDERRGFCYDLSDEFSNVLETLGVRNVDEIATRYLKARPSPRALAKLSIDKDVVLEIYRHYRSELASMKVLSLDQFTADFGSYLNSFRWEALKATHGFDEIFIDEMHLFNSQERNIVGSLLRDRSVPAAVAVAYDPRQSPRNSFFPNSENDRSTVWNDSGLQTNAKAFELRDVFRYTPEILNFLSHLNNDFPVIDLAEDWSLEFGESQVNSGPMPTAKTFDSWADMLDHIRDESQEIAKSLKRERIAILTMDIGRFEDYLENGRFQDGFTFIASREDLDAAIRFSRKPIISMPEYVAGLQFHTVFLLDANAALVHELGGGINGLHRFVSMAYLGASRAKSVLQLYADRAAGGLAQPIRDAINSGALRTANS